MLSKQTVTSCGGYLLSKQGAKKVINYFEDGIVRMKRGENYHRYICDVYWNEIQKDNKFFIFRNKFGYQRAGYSNVENVNFCRFDMDDILFTIIRKFGEILPSKKHRNVPNDYITSFYDNMRVLYYGTSYNLINYIENPIDKQVVEFTYNYVRNRLNKDCLMFKFNKM